jgi:hypothetical protein
MEEIFLVLRNFEQENQTFREFVAHLQTNQTSTSLGCVSTTQPKPKEPQISLLTKFDKNMFKVLKFCQPSAFGHPTSSLSISN